jgi:hypothetical protein
MAHLSKTRASLRKGATFTVPLPPRFSGTIDDVTAVQWRYIKAVNRAHLRYERSGRCATRSNVRGKQFIDSTARHPGVADYMKRK